MRRGSRGMTLIELTAALAIGAFLMLGAVTIFMQARATHRVMETLARLQENARFTLDIVESDLRMAHYWGLTARSELIRGRRTPVDAPGVGTHGCGDNWTLNLDEAVGGTNNAYAWRCRPFGSAAPRSDTLVVRRVGTDPVAARTAGTLYVQSARAQPGQIFAGTAVPAGYDAATSATHRLVVNGYYVDRRSSVAGMPSLRRKTLSAGGSIVDEEILVGVEDMQIELGVDTDAPATSSAPSPNRGAIDRYVEPGHALVDAASAAFDANAEILAVRVWLRLRAERTENGLADPAIYRYAGEDFGTFDDGFRRLLVSRTVYLRNARPPS